VRIECRQKRFCTSKPIIVRPNEAEPSKSISLCGQFVMRTGLLADEQIIARSTNVGTDHDCRRFGTSSRATVGRWTPLARHAKSHCSGISSAFR